jgi:signal transduction histidine kinase
MLFEKKVVTIEFNKSKLKERSKELSALLELGNLLSEALDPCLLLEKAISLVMKHFSLDAGRIYLMDTAGERLVLAAQSGIDIAGPEEMYLDEGLAGKSVRTKSFMAQHISDLGDKERAALLATKGLEVIIYVPLIVTERVVGVLNLAAGMNVGLNEKDVYPLMMMAHVIGAWCRHEKAYKQLQRKLTELEEKNETIKLFAYSASHDLKSPAVGLYGLIRRLHGKYRDLLDHEGKLHWDQILKSAQQILSLVEQINAYVAAREIPLNIERVKVSEIFSRLFEEFSSQLEERGIRWIEPASLPEVMGDELRMTRTFRNLVDNALKYGGKNLSEIRFGYHENDQFHVFSVRDNGVGVRKELAEKLFQPFQRQETSRGTEGSGLGLSISKEIAKKHNGDIWVESESGKGTVFYVSLSKVLQATGTVGLK